jgi:hypothetical protein
VTDVRFDPARYSAVAVFRTARGSSAPAALPCARRDEAQELLTDTMNRVQ